MSGLSFFRFLLLSLSALAVTAGEIPVLLLKLPLSLDGKQEKAWLSKQLTAILGDEAGRAEVQSIKAATDHSCYKSRPNEKLYEATVVLADVHAVEVDEHAGHNHRRRRLLEEDEDDHSGHDHGEDDHSGHDHGEDDHSGHDHGEDDHDDDEVTMDQLAAKVLQHCIVNVTDAGLGAAFVPTCFASVASQLTTTLACADTSLCADTTEKSEKPTAGDAWGFGMLASLISAATSLLSGVVALNTKLLKKYMQELLSFACGTLIGSAFFVLFPETAEMLGFGVEVNAVVLFGILAGFMLDIIARTAHSGKVSDVGGHGHSHGASNGHSHGDGKTDVEQQALKNHDQDHDGVKADEADAATKRSLVVMAVIGDAIHCFVDGALIGATFLLSTQVGWTVTAAIVLHELPQECGDIAIFLSGGYTVLQSIAINFVVSLVGPVGCAIALGVGTVFADSINYAAPFAGGLFLYVALTGLLPGVLQSNAKAAWWRKPLALILGIGLIALTLFMPHSHAHGDEIHTSGEMDSADPHAGHNH